MLRIIALNESEDEDVGDDVSLTKEAQEAIAESEYMRAVRLKCEGKIEHALLLLEDLLETNVLNEISIDKKNDKLCTIRYNCYKNIAFILEENMEFHKSLQNYVLATQLDENDVYTMSRLGQLALKTKLLEISDYAFGNCLRRNPFHWPAAEGMLQLHCQNYNIIGAYSWALQILLKEPNYIRALDVISDINNMFSDILPFYNDICLTYKIKFGVRSKVGPLLTVQESTQETFHQTIEPINLSKLQLEEINWLSIGKHIKCIYNYLKESNNDMMFILDINCFQKTVDVSEQNLKNLESYEIETLDKEHFQKTILNFSNGSGLERDEAGIYTSEQATSETNNLPSVGENESISQQIHQSESTNEDSDLNLKSDTIDNYKPKSRRRCSDLHFLEQWGWHKNRRYSSRKKNQQDRVEIDASLKGYLERVFSTHIKRQFEPTWPFSGNSNRSKIDTSSKSHNNNNSIEKFQEETQIGLDKFFAELKNDHFDLLSLTYKWLEFVSEYWTLMFPEDLKTTYISVYEIYMDHFDFSSWNQLSKQNLIASYRICLLFLELEYERVVRLERNISSYWKSLLSHLMHYSGYSYIISDTNYNINSIRLINMEYTSTKYENNLIKSVECLEHLEFLVDLESNNFVLHLPNLSNISISKELVKHARNDLLRKIKLNKVPDLYEDRKWAELIDIIKDNLQHSTNLNDCENWIRDLKTQFEVLLQSFWNICDVENCLVWSEMCFDFAVGKYLSKTDDSLRRNCWAESINYILTYLESSLFYEGYEILNCLGENLSRLIQNVIQVLSFHLDTPYDRHSNSFHDLDIKRPWVVLHQILLREENKNPILIRTKHLDIDAEEIESLIPQSFLILFTAHEFLGKRQLCTRDNGALLLYILDAISPNLRAPLYDSFRDIVYEYLEQVTFCLYGYPPKKARSRHIEDHESTPIEITWLKALQLFDLYRPECLPEFNSYKVESVSADMEQLLLKIVSLMSKQIEATTATAKILQFIGGERDQLPDDSDCIKLPYKISSIYYLLADYYFKNRDFAKTFKYYTLDLACNPTRLDSWAGMSLSKASKIETKLNDFLPIELSSFLTECDDTIRCFEQCIRLNQTQTLLWIEYGSFCYTIHSFCSRHLKQLSHKISLEEFTYAEEKKENMLNKAYHCFTLAATLLNNSVDNEVSDEESHEEKWLCQYMLGKITEKRKAEPKVYINYYLTAAHYLYESSATYPIKINHSNPTPLSVEALEVFYRTNSAIIKFLEHETNIKRDTGVYFKKVLKNLSSSPFAFNKAKIDGNSLNVLKRKTTTKPENILSPKLPKADSVQKSFVPIKSKDQIDCDLLKDIEDVPCLNKDDKVVTCEAEKHSVRLSIDSVFSRKSSPFRRNSNESSATAGSTTTETASSSTSSSTNSSDASSTGSESENDSDETGKKAFYTEEELLFLYESTVKNMEECATRFPEHYKSIYRLVYHYMNAPEKIRNLDRCEQLLLGHYTTNLGNQINGIFFDRKSNNIFNGIWRLPSSEIDRPGSFSTHLTKCVTILLQMLMKRNNYKFLIDIGLQLYKTPDNDKRYIKDTERVELYQQSINFCIQIMRDIFKTKSSTRNDNEILTLLIDIYKIHKKFVKHINQKEPLFTQLLIEVYKFYIQDKIEKLPENLNFLDLAIKLCLQEISSRKTQEKMLSDVSNGTNLNDIILGISNSPQTSGLSATSSTIHIPGLFLKAKNRTNATNHNSNSNLNATEAPSSLLRKDSSKGRLDCSSSPALMNPFGLKPITDPVGFQKLVAEYYKLFECGSAENIQMSLQQNFHSKGYNLHQAPLSLAAELSTEKTMTPLNCNMTTLNSSSDKSQAMCSKKIASLTPDSTNYGGSDLVLTSTYSGFSDNVNNSLSFIPSTMSEAIDSTMYSTLYNTTNTKEMLSPEISYKSFTDKSATKPDATLLTMPDQPIKQSINPTTFLQFTENLFNPGYNPSQEKFHSKVTALKTKKQKHLTPYSDQMILSKSNKAPIDLLVNTSAQVMNALSTKHFNQSTSFLAAYDLIKNAQSIVNQTSMAQTQSGCQKPTTSKRMPKSKVAFDTSDEAQKKIQTIYLHKTQTGTLNDDTSTINTCSFNLHTSNIASSFKTSLQKTTNPSLESSIDPCKNSPKTLQQKLAERQRASQQNDACETTTSNMASSIDVIILD